MYSSVTLQIGVGQSRKMIEKQKHQQSFEALGLFQIDFGLMTLISEIFLSTLFNSSLNILHNFL